MRPPVTAKAATKAKKDELPQNRLWLEARHLRLKRRFSQNFLVNEAVLTSITDCLHLTPEDKVLEIGTGGGFLTDALLKTGATLTSVEVDRNLCGYLRKKFADTPNFTLVEADFLRYDLLDTPPRYKVVGNLPYQITSKILFRLAGELEDIDYPARDRIEQITVMVQKEVAERITARPGQRAYNPLSIALQLRYEAKLEFIVPSKDFYPAPKVDSGVITLIPRSEPLCEIHDYPRFVKLIRMAFAQKRKTVRNALLNASFTDAETLDAIFASVGVDTGLRAEAISIASFGDLANAFSAHAREN